MRNKKRMRGQLEENKGFRCNHCGRWVTTSEYIGTHHRNHCPFCLWSKHVDLEKPGDRKAKCRGMMKPVGLTFKQEGIDKYGRLRQGEIMIVHLCNCGKISINRIAGDDDPEAILGVFEESQRTPDDLRKRITKAGIGLLTESDRKEIMTQLFGSCLYDSKGGKTLPSRGWNRIDALGM